jgi:galactokinase
MIEPRAKPAGRPGEAELLDVHRRDFERCYGSGGAVRVFFAPGRVNLMGAHLDYNGGPVMPVAIDRGTLIALRPRADRVVRMRSTSEKGELAFDLATDAARPRGAWVDYPLGVITRLREAGHAATGLDLLFGGNLPVGAGLSSSASICVGTAYALDQAWQLGLSPLERVHHALTAEREFVGVRCGIMDPYAVGLARRGALLWLDCLDASYEHLPLDHAAVSVVVADSGVRRELAQGAFNERVAEARRAFEGLRAHAPEATCLRQVPLAVLVQHGHALDSVARKRAAHVLGEVQRTFQARRDLLAGDLAAFGAAMVECHRSLRELYEVSVPELDCLVESAMSRRGAFGARLTGAGFGGCAVVLAETAHAAELARGVAQDFQRRFRREPRVEVFGGDEGPRELGR